MADSRSVSLEAFGENLVAGVFLLAGAVLLLATLLFGLDSFTTLETAVYPMHRWTAAGYVLTVVGLGHLFMWFDPPAPRLVRVGGGLAVLSLAATLALVIVLGLRGTGRPVDSTAALFLVVAALVPLAVGVALLGVAMVRRAAPSSAVGWVLLLLSALWVGLLGASLVFRHVAAFDGWLLPFGGSLMFGYDATAANQLVFAGHAGVALATLALGYLLWGATESAGH